LKRQQLLSVDIQSINLSGKIDLDSDRCCYEIVLPCFSNALLLSIKIKVAMDLGIDIAAGDYKMNEGKLRNYNNYKLIITTKISRFILLQSSNCGNK